MSVDWRVAGVLGVCVGGGFGYVLGSGSAEPAPDPAQAVRRSEQNPNDRARPTARGVGPAGSVGREPVEACAALKAENTVLKGQLELLGGTRLEWPDDVADGRFGPQAVQRWLEEATAELEGLETVVTLDCEEYPCVALLKYESGTSVSAAARPLMDKLRAYQPSPGSDPSLHVFPLDDATYLAMPIEPAELREDERHQERLDTRVRALAEVFLDDAT